MSNLTQLYSSTVGSVVSLADTATKLVQPVAGLVDVAVIKVNEMVEFYHSEDYKEAKSEEIQIKVANLKLENAKMKNDIGHKYSQLITQPNYSANDLAYNQLMNK